MKIVIDVPEDVYADMRNFDWSSLVSEKLSTMTPDERTITAYEYTIAQGVPFGDVVRSIRNKVDMLRNVRAEHYDLPFESDEFDERILLRSDVLTVLTSYAESWK